MDRARARRVGALPVDPAAIRAREADYVLAIKDNQPTLHRLVQETFCAEVDDGTPTARQNATRLRPLCGKASRYRALSSALHRWYARWRRRGRALIEISFDMRANVNDHDAAVTTSDLNAYALRAFLHLNLHAYCAEDARAQCRLHRN